MKGTQPMARRDQLARETSRDRIEAAINHREAHRAKRLACPPGYPDRGSLEPDDDPLGIGSGLGLQAQVIMSDELRAREDLAHPVDLVRAAIQSRRLEVTQSPLAYVGDHPDDPADYPDDYGDPLNVAAAFAAMEARDAEHGTRNRTDIIRRSRTLVSLKGGAE